LSIRLLLPQLLLTTGLHKNEVFLRELPTQPLVQKLLPVAAELVYQNKTLEGVLGVLKNWNDRKPEFPATLNPYGITGQWYPLMRDFVVEDGPAAGMRITCLTDHIAMKAESQHLHHSAENLIQDALAGHAHFFSARDRDGWQVSTFVLRRLPVGGRYEDSIAVPGVFNESPSTLYMEQHRADNNEPPSALAWEAYKALKEAIGRKDVFVNLEMAGETPESKAAKQHIPPALLQIGSDITSAMVEQRFRHYAGSRGVAFDAGKQRFRPCDTHLFSGEAPGKHKALRDLPAQECFDASGVTAGIHAVINDVWPTLAAELQRGEAAQMPKVIRLM
ncbi:MAG: hypothetical protein KGJ06_09025, partial [Pseudomonadota bacterium]|nr:hypothetical protein [Pseudomonadota bacterium]